jgi:thioredoxin 1
MLTLLAGSAIYGQTLVPPKPTVYAFTAIYCPYCWAAMPGIKNLEKSETCIVERVNVNVNKELAENYNIEGVPTLVVVENGKEVFRAEGANSPSAVRKYLENN